MPRIIFCEYEKHDTEGLDFNPWPGEIGQRIFSHIGKNAWTTWLKHQTMLLNEHRLSPMNPEHRIFLEQEMCKFLFQGELKKPAGYTPKES